MGRFIAALVRVSQAHVPPCRVPQRKTWAALPDVPPRSTKRGPDTQLVLSYLKQVNRPYAASEFRSRARWSSLMFSPPQPMSRPTCRTR